MKKIIVLFAVIVLFNTACQPEKCCLPSRSARYLNAQKDNAQWSADPSTSTIQNDTITIIGINKNPGALQETLTFKIKYAGPGNYKLDKNQVFYYTTMGNSSPVLSYKIDTLFNNSVNINYYNQTDNTINGNFDLKFIDFNSVAGNPKDISFLVGMFYVSLR